MTAFEMFKQKYTEWLKNITAREWENIKAYSEARKMTIPDYMIMCIEITDRECNPRTNAAAYWELIEMNKSKLVASNRHRQTHGQTDKFWLTKKGLKEYNRIINAE